MLKENSETNFKEFKDPDPVLYVLKCILPMKNLCLIEYRHFLTWIKSINVKQAPFQYLKIRSFRPLAAHRQQFVCMKKIFNLVIQSLKNLNDTFFSTLSRLKLDLIFFFFSAVLRIHIFFFIGVRIQQVC